MTTYAEKMKSPIPIKILLDGFYTMTELEDLLKVMKEAEKINENAYSDELETKNLN